MTNKIPPGESLWDIKQLKKYTGLSESGIRRLARRGTIPSVRINRRILFRPSSIERFILSREQGGDIPARRGRKRRADNAA
jgi:predicted DNA-binding transcriptional regulator AlpA